MQYISPEQIIIKRAFDGHVLFTGNNFQLINSILYLTNTQPLVVEINKMNFNIPSVLRHIDTLTISDSHNTSVFYLYDYPTIHLNNSAITFSTKKGTVFHINAAGSCKFKIVKTHESYDTLHFSENVQCIVSIGVGLTPIKIMAGKAWCYARNTLQMIPLIARGRITIMYTDRIWGYNMRSNVRTAIINPDMTRHVPMEKFRNMFPRAKILYWKNKFANRMRIVCSM